VVTTNMADESVQKKVGRFTVTKAAHAVQSQVNSDSVLTQAPARADDADGAGASKVDLASMSATDTSSSNTAVVEPVKQVGRFTVVKETVSSKRSDPSAQGVQTEMGLQAPTVPVEIKQVGRFTVKQDPPSNRGLSIDPVSVSSATASMAETPNAFPTTPVEEKIVGRFKVKKVPTAVVSSTIGPLAVNDALVKKSVDPADSCSTGETNFAREASNRGTDSTVMPSDQSVATGVFKTVNGGFTKTRNSLHDNRFKETPLPSTSDAPYSNAANGEETESDAESVDEVDDDFGGEEQSGWNGDDSEHVRDRPRGNSRFSLVVKPEVNVVENRSNSAQALTPENSSRRYSQLSARDSGAGVENVFDPHFIALSPENHPRGVSASSISSMLDETYDEESRKRSADSPPNVDEVAPAANPNRFKVNFNTPATASNDQVITFRDGDDGDTPVETIRDLGVDGQSLLSRSHEPSIPIQPFTGTVETIRAPNREMIAILDQLASMEQANKERDEKLDKLLGEKAHQGAGAGDVPVNGNSLGAGASRFLRTATTFTGQVSDMANQWTLQKQKIRSLESDKTSLESQLKDAKAEIASLKQSLQKFTT
jgi:hypothetical protein